MPLAAYDFGAYGNDFLPPLLGKPTLSVSYLPQPNVRLDGLLKLLASTGGGLEAGPLLRAMGIGDERARASLRFGIGRFTTEAQVDRATWRASATLTPPQRVLP